MGQIDVGRAATAGFGVIGRSPLAVLVWGLMFFALAFLPLILAYGAIGPAFAEFIQSAPADGSEPDLSAMMRLQGQMMAANALAQLGQLAAQVLLMCAVFRAVLKPQDSGLMTKEKVTSASGATSCGSSTRLPLNMPCGLSWMHQ